MPRIILNLPWFVAEASRATSSGSSSLARTRARWCTFSSPAQWAPRRQGPLGRRRLRRTTGPLANTPPCYRTPR
eukprot:8176908-Lingulodinium_polyedra.AAC.1